MTGGATSLMQRDRRSGACAPRAEPWAVHIGTIARAQGETGIQTHSRTLLHGLGSAGLRAALHTPFGHGIHWLPIFAIRPLLLNRLNKTWSTCWHRYWHGLALRRNLLRPLAREKQAMVIAQCPVSARAALEARSILHADFPVVLVCHFNYSEATEYRDKGELNDHARFEQILKFERDTLESVDQVIYVSHWARRVVEQERQIHPRSSAVIWNGIDQTPPPSSLTRADLRLADDDLALVNVGTLEPRKNQLVLLELFARLLARYPNARLLLAGDGPDRAALESRVAELRLQHAVRLLGFRRDVPDILALADIYLHAALLENCPISLLEAARAGLPIAAAPAGGVAEMLDVLGGTSLALDDLDASALMLHSWLDSPEARADAGRRAHRAFEQHFTREAMLAEYLRVLRLEPQLAETRS